MVNKKNNDKVQDEIEITNEIENTIEPELEDIEANNNQKIKTLQAKLHKTETELRDLREDNQRIKADFLNAKRRIEDERALDRIRTLTSHVEKLLPIGDSFYLAQLDKDTWAKADEKWRQGIEGIHAQLNSLLESYHITAYDPTGELFDHHRHEALSLIPVTDTKLDNRILSVIQQGYEMNIGDTTKIIRPARVTVGELQK